MFLFVLAGFSGGLIYLIYVIYKNNVEGGVMLSFLQNFAGKGKPGVKSSKMIIFFIQMIFTIEVLEVDDTEFFA